MDHHGPDTTEETPSACEQALTTELPPSGARLATIKLDSDSLAAMAVLSLRKLEDPRLNENLVKIIGEADRKGPKYIASLNEFDQKTLFYLKSICEDREIPLDSKVRLAMKVLTGDFLSEEIEERAKIIAEQLEKARKIAKLEKLSPTNWF